MTNLLIANQETNQRLASLDGKIMIINQDQKKLATNVTALKAMNQNVKNYLDTLIPPELSSLLNNSADNTDKATSSTPARQVNGKLHVGNGK